MRRRKFGLFLGTVGLSGIVATGWGLATNGLIEVSIPRAELQRRVDERLPFSGTRGPVSYVVQSAVLNLRADGRIGFASDFVVNAARREGAGHIVGSGRLEYVNGTFMLRGFDAEGLTLTRLDPPNREPSRTWQAASDLATSLAQRAGVENEVRELAEASREAIATRAFQVIVSGVRSRLDTHPVYRLQENDVKHALVRLALKEVRAESDRLVVVMDPVTALLRVLGYLALAVFACVGVVGAIFAQAAPGGEAQRFGRSW